MSEWAIHERIKGETQRTTTRAYHLNDGEHRCEPHAFIFAPRARREVREGDLQGIQITTLRSYSVTPYYELQDVRAARRGLCDLSHPAAPLPQFWPYEALARGSGVLPKGLP
jgi:hypothetical protein